MSPPERTATEIEFRNISKRFDAVVANDRVNLHIAAGTIHAIIGENGAGKSTAANILYGVHRPDSGELFIAGQPRAWSSPFDAIAAGIGMLHQHFMLAGRHTALDNIILGAEPTKAGAIDRSGARAIVSQLARQHGLTVDLDSPVEDLPVGLQQRVEILKLLYRRAQILVLDEPSAVLLPEETEELFGNLKRMRAEGKTIVLITHKLREVMSVSQNVSVMRRGQVVAELQTAKTSPQELADLMVGRKVNLRLTIPPGNPAQNFALEVRNLGLSGRKGHRPKLNQINFSIGRGEIVGLAGVEGNGQTELIQALLHPSDPHCRSQGSVLVDGTEVTGWTDRRIRDRGVAVIPEDRQHEGLLLDASLTKNFALGNHFASEFFRSGFMRWSAITETANRALAEFDVRPRDPNSIARQLSGGNQQKLIAARELNRDARLVIAAHPTRGVDVGAIEFIHAQILAARDRGCGILLVSSELDEILALSDRILAIFEGRIVGEFRRGEVTEKELGLHFAGVARS